MSRATVTASIANLVDFIKQKVSSNIVETARSKNISLNDADLQKLLSVVDMSVSQAFTLSIEDIERVLNESIK